MVRKLHICVAMCVKRLWQKGLTKDCLWRYCHRRVTFESLVQHQNMNQGHRTIDCYMGLSENRVYSQWNSHLIGIMISKTIGYNGVHYFQTHPYIKISSNIRISLYLCNGNDSNVESTGWGPRSIAFSWDISGLSRVYGRYNYSQWGL